IFSRSHCSPPQTAFSMYLPRSAQRTQHVVSRFLESLERLHKAIESLRGYRFYASSLLLLYEGDTK
ncbi:inositol polyphosphate kinase family protein, partial [Lacticaseibacillus paracasei]